MAGLIFTRLWADGWWDKGIGDRAAVYLWAACFKARMFLVNPMLIPKADIQMLIWEFTCKFGLSTLLQTQHYPKSHSSVSCKKEVKTQTKYIFTQTASLSVAYFFSLVARPWKEKKKRAEEKKRRRPLFAARLLKRLYRAWQRSLACPSLVVLFILCAVQGVSNALLLCVERETTHHILSSVPSWGMGRLWGGVYNRGGTKSKLIEGRSASKPRCTKAYKALLHAELCQM